MAHEVKLDVYTLHVKRHGKQEYVNFDSFYFDASSSKPKAAHLEFKRFFTDYVKSYQKKFWVQQTSGKAISLSSKNLKFASDQRIIFGTIEGGTTGIGSKIKKVEDISDETAFQVTKEMIESIPYYFMIWVPNDSNIGLLIVQGIGNKSISDVFRAHLKGFFNNNTSSISLIINEHIPKEAEKKMKEKGLVNSVMLRRYHLPSNKAEKILGLQYVPEEVNVEVKITGLKNVTGFSKKIRDFLTGKITQLIDIEPLSDYGIDGKHDVVVTYEHDGKTANGKLSNDFKLSPTYYLEEKDVVRNILNHPTFDCINDYCTSFLEVLKKEIKYKKTGK
jgi:hypothetical protein